ncbi:hypothetical protein KBZ21_12470 [Streptomyces sp. A73]|uniref:hypothetical protein n=1 Tax=Streptomyces TaxID=1883 RepID=UPI000C182A22|nr:MULTISPECIES: hypothetical protein [unclassified Streptomyces]MBQ0868417.1 hypothetical protein [Streptomyces sp. RK75]MBQ1123474.1 hypothetical protein [Streptomyces sp. B15]MBQ1158931.1 hypothetical protein [Streptomyces sp. A73]
MRVGISGHRGLSERTERLVRAELRDRIQQYRSEELVGISCLADGPDTWFAELVLERGGRLEAVVPAQEYREGLPGWHHDTYDRLLRQASDIHETGLTRSDEKAHMAGSEILVGLADHLVAVWDRQPARGFGGTADVVAYAQRTGTPVTIVWPDGAERD